MTIFSMFAEKETSLRDSLLKLDSYFRKDLILSKTLADEVVDFRQSLYGDGLTKLLETKWHQKKDIKTIRDFFKLIVSKFDQIIETLKTRQQDGEKEIKLIDDIIKRFGGRADLSPVLRMCEGRMYFIQLELNKHIELIENSYIAFKRSISSGLKSDSEFNIDEIKKVFYDQRTKAEEKLYSFQEKLLNLRHYAGNMINELQKNAFKMGVVYDSKFNEIPPEEVKKWFRSGVYLNHTFEYGKFSPEQLRSKYEDIVDTGKLISNTEIRLLFNHAKAGTSPPGSICFYINRIQYNSILIDSLDVMNKDLTWAQGADGNYEIDIYPKQMNKDVLLELGSISKLLQWTRFQIGDPYLTLSLKEAMQSVMRSRPGLEEAFSRVQEIIRENNFDVTEKLPCDRLIEKYELFQRMISNQFKKKAGTGATGFTLSFDKAVLFWKISEAYVLYNFFKTQKSKRLKFRGIVFSDFENSNWITQDSFTQKYGLPLLGCTSLDFKSLFGKPQG